MLDITLVAVGSVKNKAIAGLVSEYEKRLRPYARLKIRELPARSFSDKSQEAAKKQEEQAIIEYLNKLKIAGSSAKVYLLAESGRSFTSSQLAVWLNKSGPVVFILGGALGFSRQLKNDYPSLSLSPLTFPHELARLIFFEQLYRAATIIQGKNYHY